MTEYEKKIEELNKASNFIKGFCAICSNPRSKCGDDCVWNVLSGCVAFKKNVVTMFEGGKDNAE